MNYKRIVPNTISGISLVLGVISIFYTIEKDFSLAAICIILSVVADSLDGRAARLLGVSGPFRLAADSPAAAFTLSHPPAQRRGAFPTSG